MSIFNFNKKNKKYKLTNKKCVFQGHILHRIKAVKSFGSIRKGMIGGWVESEANLSQEDFCWIYSDAKVYSNATVYDNAQIYDNVIICGSAQVYGNAKIYDNVIVEENSNIYENATVYDNCHICGNAEIRGDVDIYDNVKISGNAIVYGFSKIFKDAIIYGNARVWGFPHISGGYICDNAKIYDDAVISNNAIICNNAKVFNNGHVFGNAIISDSAVVKNYGYVDGLAHIANNAIITDRKDYMIIEDIILNENIIYTHSNKTFYITDKFSGNEHEFVSFVKRELKTDAKYIQHLINYIHEVYDNNLSISYMSNNYIIN